MLERDNVLFFPENQILATAIYSEGWDLKTGFLPFVFAVQDMRFFFFIDVFLKIYDAFGQGKC